MCTRSGVSPGLPAPTAPGPATGRPPSVRPPPGLVSASWTNSVSPLGPAGQEARRCLSPTGRAAGAQRRGSRAPPSCRTFFTRRANPALGDPAPAQACPCPVSSFPAILGEQPFQTPSPPLPAPLHKCEPPHQGAGREGTGCWLCLTLSRCAPGTGRLWPSPTSCHRRAVPWASLSEKDLRSICTLQFGSIHVQVASKKSL